MPSKGCHAALFSCVFKWGVIELTFRIIQTLKVKVGTPSKLITNPRERVWVGPCQQDAGHNVAVVSTRHLFHTYSLLTDRRTQNLKVQKVQSKELKMVDVVHVDG